MNDSDGFLEKLGDTAKAVTNSCNIPNKLVDKFTDAFIKSLLNSASEISEPLSVELQFITAKRRARLTNELNRIYNKYGFPPLKPIPPKFAVEILQNAEIETDDDLQDIWIRLLSNSIDATKDVEPRSAYIDIIKNLSKLDAHILDTIYTKATDYAYGAGKMPLSVFFEGKHHSGFDKRKLLYYSTNEKVIQRCINCSDEDFDVSIHNLLRLQCIEYSDLEEVMSAVYSITSGDELNSINLSTANISLTALGLSFIEACISSSI